MESSSRVTRNKSQKVRWDNESWNASKTKTKHKKHEMGKKRERDLYEDDY